MLVLSFWKTQMEVWDSCIVSIWNVSQMPMCWGLDKQTTAPLGGGQTIKKQNPMGESGVTGSATEKRLDS